MTKPSGENQLEIRASSPLSGGNQFKITALSALSREVRSKSQPYQLWDNLRGLWDALGSSGSLSEALGASVRLWEALGGSGRLEALEKST